MEDSRSHSDVVADTSVDRMIRARYSLDLKSMAGSPLKDVDLSSESVPATPKQSSKASRRISEADATRTHHEEMPLVMVREMARGHSGAYQWRRGAIFVSYPPVQQKELHGMELLINQKCYCHSKAPWRTLELFNTSTYAAGPHSYGDITLLLGTLATYSPEQLYLFSDPEDTHILDRYKHRHDFKLPNEPFTLPLKCLYAVHQRNALAKLLPWFRVPVDTMAIYMEILESSSILVDGSRGAEMETLHEWISDLLRRCKGSDDFKEVERVEVKVKRRRNRETDSSKRRVDRANGTLAASPRFRYVVKARILHRDGRGSSWSFALETNRPEHGVEFVTRSLNTLRPLGPASKVIVPKRQWNAIDSPMLVALSSLTY
ncbi:hypothetical protein PENSPDRAFT_749369 [Peniophora sp. CONT]|nr:hypothetical protein PENSPDRAFT_749369 [Peniophora sp. CONT]